MSNGAETPGGEAQPAVPAGWYPHPTAPGWEAYWDGSAWGTETRPAQAAGPPEPATEQQPAQPAAEPATQEAAVTGQEAAVTEQQPVQPAAPAAAAAGAGAAAAPAAAGGRGSALPVVLCVLGAVVAIVGTFLPEAKLDVNGTSIDLVDNTMFAAGYGIAVIAAAVLGAAIAVWAYLKGVGNWLPILLGVVIAGIAVYAGTAGLDVTPDLGTLGPAGGQGGGGGGSVNLTDQLTDQADPDIGIYAVGAGGLLMLLGGIGLLRESR
jgi:hypothetical protein